MEMTPTDIDLLMDERDTYVKSMNTVIFVKIFKTLQGMANAFKVDFERLTLLDINRTESDYIIRVFVHAPGTKKDETIGEDLFVDIPFYLVKLNDSSEVENYITDKIIHNMTTLTATPSNTTFH